jgi:hypothetical protein
MKVLDRSTLAARTAFFLILAGVLMMVTASAAEAETVTVGSPLTATFESKELCGSICTEAQLALPGATVASPTDGTIIRWRIKSSEPESKFKLQLLHPAGFEAFTGTGTTAVGESTSFGTQVFDTDLPIRAGDMAGIDNVDGTSTIGHASTVGSKVGFWGKPFPDGSTIGPDGTGGPLELAYNFDVRPLPGISSVSPASGPIGGGTSVTIAGHDFTGTTAVTFGGVPAASFTVGSDTQLTAVSPPGSPGAVDIGVRNPGQSPKVGTDSFAYTACVVPKLKGKKLKAVKKALKSAGCKLGKVKGEKTNKAKVKKQSAKPGTKLAPGSTVNVKLA